MEKKKKKRGIMKSDKVQEIIHIRKFSLTTRHYQKGFYSQIMLIAGRDLTTCGFREQNSASWKKKIGCKDLIQALGTYSRVRRITEAKLMEGQPWYTHKL